MRHTRLIPVLGLIILPLGAQTFDVVPSKAAITQDGKYYSFSLLYGAPANNAAHTQCLYDTTDVATIAGVLDGVAIRRDNYLSGTHAATTLNLTIETSVSAIAHSAASATFASNHGANRVMVFNGPVSLPARTMGTWPQPWENVLAFSTPVTYARPIGKSLVIDFITSGSSSGAIWYADAYVVGYGTSLPDLFQSNCRHSGNTTSSGFGSTAYQPYPGGEFQLSFTRMPMNVPSFNINALIVGARGVGGTFGAYTLPVPFATLGIPAPANCRLGVEYLFTMPMTYVTSTVSNQGSLQITFPFPNDRALIGASFVTQGVAVDTNPVTSAPEVFPTISLKWNVGSGDTVPASTVNRVADTTPPAPTGTVRVGEVPVLQLRFQ